MKILFLHGLESKPGGTKVKALLTAGHSVFNPALPKSSFEESVRIAQEIIDKEKPAYIVGSSRGGAVAMSVDPGDAKLVLIAPAWKRFKVAPIVRKNTVILHSEADDIVLFADSQELAAETGASLQKCGECHRMYDEEALDVLKYYVGR